MNKIYIAGPSFSKAEKKFNNGLAKKLEEAGLEVFLPQRDGIRQNDAKFEGMDRDQKRKAMFDIDRDKILECGTFLFVLDGRVPDEGSCVGLGMVYAQKFLNKTDKIIVGLHTDSRAGLLNSMVKMPFDEIVEDEDEFVKFLKKGVVEVEAKDDVSEESNGAAE